ncbi:nucleoside triphosphate pyrophosphohydrolase [Proteinivorax hydrogeniformans]|uniref:Nucleoside triphosphate pyrophosphohydrolase n=1 Tax=Proteinivorax hydrogeniformans TaxID=1826727 RepID=A0AAU8HQK2_9FIRM
MQQEIYNKLVRDKIPEIIKASNKHCECAYVTDSELQKLLDEKLIEEVNEYLESGKTEELADIIEVIYGILKIKGIDSPELEAIRLKKKRERGGFEKGVLLKKVWKEKSGK